MRRIRKALPTDKLVPMFGRPITNWLPWFAWRPVDTSDEGVVWLRPIYRRRVNKVVWIDGGAEQWWQYAVLREVDE